MSNSHYFSTFFIFYEIILTEAPHILYIFTFFTKQPHRTHAQNPHTLPLEKKSSHTEPPHRTHEGNKLIYM